MSAGRIEQVANQWRCHDHITGGVWTYDSEERALRCLRALELREASQRHLKAVEEVFLAKVELDGLTSLVTSEDVILAIARGMSSAAREKLAEAAEDEMKLWLAKNIRAIAHGG